MRIFAISDLHTDKPPNLAWVENLSDRDYTGDALIIAGDVSANLDRLEWALADLAGKFAQVFFVPGNHDLWVHPNAQGDSLEKLDAVLSHCASLDIQTNPQKVGAGDPNPAWIVPLFAWYRKPEDGDGSLHHPRQGEDPDLPMWSDHYFIRWPNGVTGFRAAGHFLTLNKPHLQREYAAPVITFSHFLPRQELVWSDPAHRSGPLPAFLQGFNFSRVAGDAKLDAQLRAINAVIHIYGHQHRNRYCEIDGVLYVSHCLGYPFERAHGFIRGLGDGPKLIWDTVSKTKEISEKWG